MTNDVNQQLSFVQMIQQRYQAVNNKNKKRFDFLDLGRADVVGVHPNKKTY